MAGFVSLLGTGGTIAAREGPAGATPGRGVEELLHGLRSDPETEVRARDVMQVASRSTTPRDMWELAQAVQEEIAAGATGVVVTHGTDTMEETAYALALLLDTPVPVVLTGAMRPAHVPGSDAAANLAGALCAARAPALAAYGPVVVHQDEVHAARWVTKMFSSRVAAFASPSAGPVGLISEGAVTLLLGPPPGSDRLPATSPPARRVELVWAVAGADGLLVDSVAGHVDGLVVAGTGGGHVSSPLAESLLRLVAAGRPVVLASRCAGPHVLHGTYGGVGSEIQLLADGLLSAADLPPLKARLRLLFGLSADLPAERLFPAPEGVR